MWSRLALSLLLFSSAAVAAADDWEKTPGKIWYGEEEAWETALREAEVLDIHEVGYGVTSPKRLHLRYGDRRFRAVFKPIERGRDTGFWESYEAEIAAYRIDRMLGLGMVPPTVDRRIDGKTGSVQLWVEGCQLYHDVRVRNRSLGALEMVRWNRELAKMKFFDQLIANPDRNTHNFLVDEDNELILIDHSRAFAGGKNLERDPAVLPKQFQRSLLDAAAALTQEGLQGALQGVLMKGQIRSLLKRRDALLAYQEELVKEQGGHLLFD